MCLTSPVAAERREHPAPVWAPRPTRPAPRGFSLWEPGLWPRRAAPWQMQISKRTHREEAWISVRGRGRGEGGWGEGDFLKLPQSCSWHFFYFLLLVVKPNRRSLGSRAL